MYGAQTLCPRVVSPSLGPNRHQNAKVKEGKHGHRVIDFTSPFGYYKKGWSFHTKKHKRHRPNFSYSHHRYLHLIRFHTMRDYVCPLLGV